MAKAVIYLTLVVVVFASLADAVNYEGEACYAPDPKYYGFYAPHPVYCHQFLQCTHGIFIARNCAAGLQWNPYEGFNGACDHPRNFDCQGLTTVRTTTSATTVPTTGTTTVTTPEYESTTYYETTYYTTES